MKETGSTAFKFSLNAVLFLYKFSEEWSLILKKFLRDNRKIRGGLWAEIRNVKVQLQRR